MKTLIDNGFGYEVYHHTGEDKYRGCCCSNENCNCAIKKQPELDFYTVKKTKGKIRTTEHKTLEQVEKRIKEIFN